MNTNNHRRFAPLLVLLAFIAAAPAMAVQISSSGPTGEERGLTNSVCPVMPDETVDPSFFTDHDGSRVYFCCRRCVLRFEQNPEAYAETLAQVMPVAIRGSTSQARAGGHDHDHPEEADVAEESDADIAPPPMFQILAVSVALTRRFTSVRCADSLVSVMLSPRSLGRSST